MAKKEPLLLTKGVYTRHSFNVRFGSVAAVRTHSSPMTALGWKADTRSGRMSALTDTGRSEVLKRADLNDRFRPRADAKQSIRLSMDARQRGVPLGHPQLAANSANAILFTTGIALLNARVEDRDRSIEAVIVQLRMIMRGAEAMGKATS